jgi:hypothetical protein
MQIFDNFIRSKPNVKLNINQTQLHKIESLAQTVQRSNPCGVSFKIANYNIFLKSMDLEGSLVFL